MTRLPRTPRALAVALLPLLSLLASAGCAEGLASDDTAGAGTPAPTTDDGGATSPGSGSGGGGGNGSSSGSGGNGSSSGGGSGGGTHSDGGVSSGSGSYNVDLAHTSVSGFSSGGFFAVQFHVAFSSIMSGAAIFAGGPFDCAQGSVTTALTTCTSATTAPATAPLVTATQTMASSGLIDDPKNLAGQRVYLFGGAEDTTVNPVVMDSLNTYYGAFMSASSIQYDSRYSGATHTFPTASYGNACDLSETPWVSNCTYDAAGKALAQIYGTLSPAATTLSGTYVSLAQGDFVSNPASHSLGDTAYAYVPASCAAGASCRIHVAFHGCEQEVTNVSDAFYKHAGFNEWADTNHIIVLYPQTISSDVTPSNPDACWDWWGYDDPNYANKTGTQMAMVRAMIDYLATGSGAISDAGTD